MELFDKIYGCYYTIVQRILTEAGSGDGLSSTQLYKIARTLGYEESAPAIVPALTEDTWPLLYEDKHHHWHSRLTHTVSTPLTRLQLSWLRALMEDPRFSLFLSQEAFGTLNEALKNTEPLFSWKDFYYYDRFTNGDDYSNPHYQEIFQIILQAVRTHRMLTLSYLSPKSDGPVEHSFLPQRFQFSEKNNRFRIQGMEHFPSRGWQMTLLNINRILNCSFSNETWPDPLPAVSPVPGSQQSVVIEISGERNSLERCMLHFASYEKHTEYDENHHVWICRINYNQSDETELLIQILSFGPVIRVLEPESFLKSLRERVRHQHELFTADL